MDLGSEFQLAIECKMKLGSRNYQIHWTRNIELHLGMTPPLMSHGSKHHFWPILETRVLISETHCNFCNGGSKALKWTMRAYGNLYHLSCTYVHLL